MSIDPNVKGAISESFDKSHLSESFDVPAGCKGLRPWSEIRKNLRVRWAFRFQQSGMKLSLEIAQI